MVRAIFDLPYTLPFEPTFFYAKYINVLKKDRRIVKNVHCSQVAFLERIEDATYISQNAEVLD